MLFKPASQEKVENSWLLFVGLFLHIFAFLVVCSPTRNLDQQASMQQQQQWTLRSRRSDEINKGCSSSLDVNCRRASTRQLMSNNNKRGDKVKLELNHLFREESESYPEEEIRLALKKAPEELKELYNVLNTPLDPNVNLTERVALHYTEDLTEDGARDEPVCRSISRNIYPRQARLDNTLVYVPNNQEFMQVIQADICQNAEKDCDYLYDNLPHGLTSVCQQKYAYKKLMYLDSLKERMETAPFIYPSCCSCYVRRLPFDLRSANSSTSTLDQRNRKLNKPLRDSEISLDEPISSRELVNRNIPVSNSSELVEEAQVGNSQRRAKASSVLNEATQSSASTRLKVRDEETFVPVSVSSRNRNKTKNSSLTSSSSSSSATSTNSTQQTIVLLEDKVYKASSRK